MFGNVFFRDFPYKLVTHARVFSLSFVDKNINPKAALFISVNMQFLNKIFSYSNMASWQKIKKLGLAVFVPFKNGKIDSEYMEKFINILEEERLQILETYLQVSSLDNCQLTDAELNVYNNFHGKKKFKLYRIEELFNIHPTSAYHMTNDLLFKITGKNPVVTNSSVNNGISGYINLPPTEKGGIVTYSDTTTSDGIFYQPDDFIGYSHVQGVYPINKSLWNSKSLLFFVSAFRRSAGGRFDYANKFNRTIAKKMNISLPVTDDNEIDYNFMETYIKAIEKKVIQKVIAWKDSEMKTLKASS